MTIKEAISARHMVRTYTDKPIPVDIVIKLNGRIALMNDAHGVQMKLITGENAPVWGLMRLMGAKGTRNYLLLGSPTIPDAKEKLGYCGIDIALYAQTLGLNSWWISGTFSKGDVKEQSGTAVQAGILVLGYGATQGVPHMSKFPEDVSSYEGNSPEWFREGVKAALFAPTANNKQAFFLKGSGEEVHIDCNNSIFTDIDRGIVKYHFEAGAGKDNFVWV